MRWDGFGFFALLALTAILVGCGESDSAVDAYREGDGDSGIVHFVLDADTPLIQGTNDLRISMHEIGTDVPWIGAKVIVMATMPAMAHGTLESPAIHELGDGSYLAHSLSLPMAGRWEIQVDTRLADKHDAVKFTYDLH